MSRIGSWLRGSSKPSLPPPSRPPSALDETNNLKSALDAAIMIMNDDVEGADQRLAEGNSSFHKLGTGVTFFIRSILGFEQETMREAAARLIDAENTAWSDMKRAQKEGAAGAVFHSNIYPAGSEFALCYAMAQLMSAVVAVLNESLTESIKGFYKLRKAYATLDAIIEVEHQYMRQKQGLNESSKTSLSSQGEENMPGQWSADEFSEPSSTIANQTDAPIVKATVDDESDLVFVDADEAHMEAQISANYLGHVESHQDIEGQLDSLALNKIDPSQKLAPGISERLILDDGSGSNVFSNPIDVFVHSGTNLCYGLLLLLISMVPPAFSKLLYVVGFKGDRERGISLLWQATKYDNICGAVAGLFLLGYYNGLIGFCDILLTDADALEGDMTGYPKARCEALLALMRKRYPESHLWMLEEGRMLSGNRELKAALAMLSHNDHSKMKQVAALNMFEKSLTSMYLHEYSVCAQSFLDCIELNNWSHSLYYFCVGACYVELYRDHRESDPATAEKYRQKATEHLRKAPTCAGKRRLMAKQLPFDVFVVRKVQKWEERAKAWSCDLIDAVGVSPIEEMIYLWNGTKRMSRAELDISMVKLDFSRATHPEKHETNLDEVAIQTLLKSTILRNCGQLAEAREILMSEIMKHDKADFKGHLKDDWTCPSAHYEMAVIAWHEKDLEGMDQKAKIAECEEWLQKVSHWDSYVLDSRIGLKITTAMDTLKQYHKHTLQG